MAHVQAKQPSKAQLEAEELSLLCEQISLIIRSGLPLHDGIEALCDNYRNTRFEAHFNALNQAVLKTGSLYQGLVDAGIFPAYLAEMAHIGERTGELDSVMSGLSLYYQREAKIRRAVVNAVAYPIILLLIMAVLIAVLISQVLPVFDGVFRGIGAAAAVSPWMNAGIGAGRVVLMIAGALVALLLVLLLLMRIDRSGRTRLWIFNHVRPLKKISDKISASRFATVMSMMLHSGFPLDESLALVSGVITNQDVARRVQDCRAQMEAGLSFPDAVEKLGIFETLHSRMIRVGFQAGQTDAVMRKLASLYEDEVDDAISHVVSIIEPTLVALMSVMIGAILLAVMLPLLSIMGGMA